MKANELLNKVEELRKECNSIQDKYLEAGKSWDEYRQNPKVREYWKTLAEYRLVQDYKLHPISGDCGTHMTLEEFKVMLALSSAITMAVVIMQQKRKCLIYHVYHLKFVMDILGMTLRM